MRRLPIALTCCLLAFSLSLIAGSTVVQDTMTGTAGTDLNARTGELGATWVRATGFTVPLILSDANRVRVNGTGSDGIYYASGTPTINEYDIDLDITCLTVPADTQFPMIYARIDTAGINGYRMVYDSSVSTWYEQVWTGGAWSGLTSGVSAMGAATTTHFKWSIRSGAKVFAGAGVQIVTTADNTNTAVGKGAIGMFSTTTTGNTIGYHYDNFVITNAGGTMLTFGVANRRLPTFGFRLLL